MRTMSLMTVVLAAVAVGLFTHVPIGAVEAQSYESPSVIQECKLCLESAVADSGKRASVAAFFTGIACAASGPASPLVCPIAAGGAAAASALNDLLSASRCAQQPACTKLAAALKAQNRIDCIVSQPAPATKCPQKVEYRTKSIIRNGFGTTVQQSCNAFACGDSSAKKCASVNVGEHCGI